MTRSPGGQTVRLSSGNWIALCLAAASATAAVGAGFLRHDRQISEMIARQSEMVRAMDATTDRLGRLEDRLWPAP